MSWIEDRLKALKNASSYSGIPWEELQDRRSGRSTGLALIAIGQALTHPGEEIRIKDHYDSREADELLMRTTFDLVSKLELEGFTFNKAYKFIRFDLLEDKITN